MKNFEIESLTANEIAQVSGGAGMGSSNNGAALAAKPAMQAQTAKKPAQQSQTAKSNKKKGLA